MPDMYDSGVRVTDLRIRGAILEQVSDGRRHRNAFERIKSMEKRQIPTEGDPEAIPRSDTATSSHLDAEVDIADFSDFVRVNGPIPDVGIIHRPLNVGFLVSRKIIGILSPRQTEFRIRIEFIRFGYYSKCAPLKWEPRLKTKDLEG